MQKYYLHNGTENIGPFDLEELKTKGVTKTTMIWYEGIEEWKEAGSIEELKSILPIIPPPINKKSESKTSENVAKKKTNWRLFILKVFLSSLLVMICLVALGKYIDSKTNSSSYEEHIMSVAEIEAHSPINYLETEGNYRGNFLGNKIKINGIIRNKATVTTYKDVIIEVAFYSNTDTEITTEKYTLYEFYPPTSQKEFKLKVDNYRNVAKISWRIVGALTK